MGSAFTLYKSAMEWQWQRYWQCRNLTTFSSIDFGFTINLDSPPPPPQPRFPTPSCRYVSPFLDFPLMGVIWNWLRVGWDFSATCSLTPLIRRFYMAVYIRQTFVQTMEDASFCLEIYSHLTREMDEFAHLRSSPDCVRCVSVSTISRIWITVEIMNFKSCPRDGTLGRNL